MGKLLLLLIAFISSFSFCQEEKEIMYVIHDGETSENCGYVNAKGDTIFPIGTFFYCFSDSMDFAIVENLDKEEGFPAYDSNGNEVFRVFTYDNGPDYIEDGTFRIIKNGLIGYATEDGKVIIPPTYEAAWPFKNGRAEVSFEAEIESDGEHSWWVGGNWFYIDKNGNRHEDQSTEH